MDDWIESFLGKIGIKNHSAIALQFIIGIGLVAISLAKYNNDNQILPVIGVLFGGYLILKAVQ